MKKWIFSVSVVFTLALLMSVTAFAAEAEGIDTAQSTASGVSLTVESAEKVKVTYNAAGVENGKDYLVIATKNPVEASTLKAEEIVYIDQQKANGGEVSFTIYPMTLDGGDYHVYLSSNATTGIQALQEVGTYHANGPAYKRGDVHVDGKINTLDALAVVNHFVGRTLLTGAPLQAADVAGGTDNRGDGRINTLDALKIVNCFVGRIKEAEL